MLFNSFEFAIFFILVSFLYYRIEHSHQNWLLLVGSYFFYGWWDWRFLSLLAISTGIDFFCGLWINQSSDPKKRHFYLMVSIVSNLGMLGFFKYFHFFIDSVQAGAQILFGWTLDTPTLQILLPVGISFYTFQTLS
ncbi:MAG: MBOAT family protein, partial [Planctomycetota bacterium]